jgi:FkbM family methyltransferase
MMIAKLINSLLSVFDIRLVRNSQNSSAADLLQRYRKEICILEMTRDPEIRAVLFNLLDKSQSQTAQDLMALLQNDFKMGGFFVEIGSTDGVGISNTLILEREFSWTGILCEPGSFWIKALKKNRPNSIIVTKCCWSVSGKFLEFLESNEKELSTIAQFSTNDSYRKIRKQGYKYMVETVSLEDLLKENNAPATIDFLSVDTEGSEFFILKDFPFDKYSFRFAVVEHNFGPHRLDILEIFSNAGYSQVCENVSAQDFWFVPKGNDFR